MSQPTETRERTGVFDTEFAWQSGAIAGAVATVAMGLVITVVEPELISELIAGLYGMSGNLLVGWLAHLIHGIVFGVLFAYVLMDPALYGASQAYWRTVVAGVLYGLFLAVAGGGIVMPIWLAVVGFAGPPSIPFLDPTFLAWHVVYGVVLGVVFPYVADRGPGDEP